ncbi:hypothetical protein CAPTEDRAFT_216986 [Capitella teleta]|uniref:Uncharacterized protein n=1 Tax=Capitella teleta TaxID=283909 RepID=R7T9Z3_CAPTE|nr:hypothetical protein CAPTEDRAFT_216986 [Capitella teleta]|eukprot:ELT88195.1 hypothetical protein CAPTEDRAFT_216986 [Capitella teleta]
MAANLDLLPPGTTKLFRVDFDYYTPRPHFIVLGKSKQITWSSYDGQNSQFVEELMRVANKIRGNFGLRKPLLSVHRGSWLVPGKDDKFHAHICTDSDTYMRVFNDKKGLIPGWPSSRYVTKEWRASKNPSHYEENVRRYPYKEYFDDEIKQARRRLEAGNVRPWANPEGWTLFFHESAARVGFAPTGQQSREDLLIAMERFIREHATGSERMLGCHVCLALTAEACDGFPSPVFGYIQLSADDFCNGCPADYANGWLSRFEQEKLPTLT